MPAYVARNGALVVSKRSPDECIIFALRSVVEELLAKTCLGIRRFGNNQKTTGILIYTMNQTDCRVIGVKTFVIAQMPSKSIDKRPTIITTTGMHDKTCRFVNDEQSIILVNNIKRQILRNDFPITLRMVKNKRNDVACLNLIIALDWLVVCSYASCLGCLLYAVTTGSRHVVH